MLTNEQRLDLICDLYRVCYANAPFREIGTELAYLTKAITSNMKCELNPTSTFVKLLQKSFNSYSAIWDFIHLEQTVVCINCESEILLEEASFCRPLDGWLGHYCCANAGTADEVDDYYDEVTIS